jgi:NAD(P)H-dependent flavin oxidoreductase YrpB (nitropropane dioxygenase family)
MGADIVTVQAARAGGHAGSVPTALLLAQVTAALRVPVVAAGGMTAPAWSRRWPRAPKASPWARAS